MNEWSSFPVEIALFIAHFLDDIAIVPGINWHKIDSALRRNNHTVSKDAFSWTHRIYNFRFLLIRTFGEQREINV